MMVLDWPDDGRAGARRCRHCGSAVSKGFARVFGDNEDRVHGCPACTTFRDLSEGGGLAEEADGRPTGTDSDRSMP